MKLSSSNSRNHVLDTAKKPNKGFTLVEILIVVVIIGLLAAMAIPALLGGREATGDVVKADMARSMNDKLAAVKEGGVDLTSYTDAASMLAALEAGIDIPSPVGGKPMTVRVDSTPNPAAFTFTAGTASVAPRFVANLGQPTVPATLTGSSSP